MKKISIITIGRNEEENLKKLYESMKRLTYPRRFYEVLYVDGNSSDKSREVAKAYGARVYREDKPLGRGNARNYALRKARYPIIAWIDPDCEIVDRDWLQNMLAHLKGRVVGVSGTQSRSGGGLSRLISYLPGMTVEVRRVQKTSWAPTTSSLFLKKPILDVGGYAKELTTAEDLELCWRLADRGYEFVQTPKARVVTHHRSTLKKFWKQQWERGVCAAIMKKSRCKTYFDAFFNATYLLVMLAFLSVLAYPPLLILLLLSPVFLYVSLNGLGLFPRVVAEYVKKEKSLFGVFGLIALNYVKTFALLGGVVQHQVSSRFKR